MSNILRFFSLLAAAIVLVATSPAFAKGLEVDLSKPDVRLDVSFKGADLLLFGATDHEGDIIVVVRGPDKDTSIRLKERIAGIWVSTDEVVFAGTPGFYALASSKPIDDLLPSDVLAKQKIGTDNLGLTVKSAPDGATDATLKNFKDGLVRNMVAKNLYTGEPGKIDLLGKQLFRTDLWFPANVHVGEYVIDTYLVSEGKIATHNSTQLTVHKVGLEAEIYSFAHDHALIYGLLAILIAVVSGWTANAVFKKRG
ncbi:TIGR02186 family protein [Magnetovibrio sp.]|uniref:TIGR02186 family protein n=1 Tax=Magnetovibrio sp. TaxID=2024836 RepID=UPI002F93BC11